jgi:16S rRNA (uracil1498-N3)-methyltransferase
MSRRRFFTPPDNIRGNSAVLPADEAHHLRHVLRLRDGDAIEIFDGCGNAFAGRLLLSEAGAGVVGLERTSTEDASRPRLILAQSLLKMDKFEWVLQKATELGVHEVVPLNTRYCDVRLNQARVEARMGRWGRIVREAAKQCRRPDVPQVRQPEEFARFAQSVFPAGLAKLLLYENASRRWERPAAGSPGILLCIGSEGGWHADEVRAAEIAGFQTFSLGARILRAETAALTALVLAQEW